MEKKTVSWDTFDSIFGLKCEAAQDLASEHLADHMVKYTYEITINIKQQKEWNLIEHQHALVQVFEKVASKYKSQQYNYYVEYCKTGVPHIHGYITVAHPAKVVNYDERLLLESMMREIRLLLPKKYFKQKLEYAPHYRRLKSIAVCINLKDFLETKWVEYIKKNAPK